MTEANELRWVFETVFAPGTTREQALAYMDVLKATTKQLGLDLDVHGRSRVFGVDEEDVEEDG